MFKKQTISRRDLLKGFGAAGLLSATAPVLAGCAPDSSSSGSGSSEGTAVTALAYNGNPPYCYLDSNGDLKGYEK